MLIWSDSNLLYTLYQSNIPSDHVFALDGEKMARHVTGTIGKE